jgi:hypothetical protein
MSSVLRYPKENFFEGSENSPARPSDTTSIKMSMSKPVCRIDGILLTGEIGSTGRKTCPTAFLSTMNSTSIGRYRTRSSAENLRTKSPEP